MHASCGSCSGDVKAVKKEHVKKTKDNALVMSVPDNGKISGLVITSCGKCNLGTEDRGCSLSVKIGENWKTFINPEITKYYGELFINNERCLSIPKKDFNVNRFNSVDIVYRDTNFIEHTAKYSALTAIVLQHELDHLDGVLISMKNN